MPEKIPSGLSVRELRRALKEWMDAYFEVTKWGSKWKMKADMLRDAERWAGKLMTCEITPGEGPASKWINGCKFEMRPRKPGEGAICLNITKHYSMVSFCHFIDNPDGDDA